MLPALDLRASKRDGVGAKRLGSRWQTLPAAPPRGPPAAAAGGCAPLAGRWRGVGRLRKEVAERVVVARRAAAAVTSPHLARAERELALRHREMRARPALVAAARARPRGGFARLPAGAHRVRCREEQPSADAAVGARAVDRLGRCGRAHLREPVPAKARNVRFELRGEGCLAHRTFDVRLATRRELLVEPDEGRLQIVLPQRLLRRAWEVLCCHLVVKLAE